MGVVQAGRALGSRYQLVEPLGSGAMGEVWKTLDRTTGEHVAAKLLRGEYARDPQIVARFVQERAILLALDHPNIVGVRDLVVEGDDLAIVMELVGGSDLRTYLDRRGPLPPHEAVTVTVAVLRALAHAHAHDFLHRDVKPDNVLLHDGHARLSDFGIARIARETSVRATGALGTPEYMAPELFVAQEVGAAADVYGAGIQLYELLAGRTPFAGGTNPYAVVSRHVNAAPPPLPGLPPRLDAVLATMLAKEPRRRLSAEAAAQALTELLPELEGLPALGAQAQPAAFDAPPTGDQAGSAATADPDGTRVRGLAPAPAVPLPVHGDVVAVSPDAPLAAPGETSLGGVRPHEAPVLRPAVVEGPAPSRRGRLVLAAAAVVLVAAAGAAAVAVLGGRDRGASARPAAPAGTGAVTATVRDSTLPTGLTVTRSAKLDPATEELRVTVTWHAGRTPLQGPFYENVPDPDCQVHWDGVHRGSAVLRGITAPCGFSVDPGTVRESGEKATYVVRLRPEGDPATAVEAFLDEAAARTTAALKNLPGVTDFPVQRLDGIEIEPLSQVFVGEPIVVTVLPRWVGTEGASGGAELFTSDSPDDAPFMLRKVAGGLAGVQITARTCSNAIAIDGRTLSAIQRARDCELDVRVGQLEARSTAFDISYRSAR